MRDGVRLFMNFLFHEMPVAALVNNTLTGRDNDNLTIDRRTGAVKHLCPIGANNGKVVIFQIDDITGEM